jgi:hypothetical protein
MLTGGILLGTSAGVNEGKKQEQSSLEKPTDHTAR